MVPVPSAHACAGKRGEQQREEAKARFFSQRFVRKKISRISEKDLAGSGVTYTVSAPFDERPPGKRRRVTREDFRQFLSRRFLRSEFGRIFEKDLAKRGETHRVSPPFE